MCTMSRFNILCSELVLCLCVCVWRGDVILCQIAMADSLLMFLLLPTTTLVNRTAEHDGEHRPRRHVERL